MKATGSAWIETENGDSMNVPLYDEGGFDATVLTIDGIRYHFERIERSKLKTEFRVDRDPDYEPQSDSLGRCYILAPFSTQ